tara:strand:+ start:9871 stop:10263 length:393 start_codon:yes stop_codon:yes gene_type:complete
MTAFNWTISATERAVSLDGLPDVIQVIHWRYRGTDQNGVTAETYGATSVGAPNPQDFTPYDGITAADVEGWLESLLDVPTMQTNLEAQIASLINPTTITGPLYSSPAVEEVVETVEETVEGTTDSSEVVA